jgi:hypothetical protein
VAACTTSIEASPCVVNSTFYGNSADNDTLVCGNSSDVALENVIIAFNVSGAFGQGCGGVTAVEHASWGAVKAMYR